LVRRWDVVEVSWSDNLVRNLTNGQAQPFEPLARSAIELLEAGGLVPYLQASQRSPQNA
jgi:hypothetical protein